jgi:hypothetical protein
MRRYIVKLTFQLVEVRSLVNYKKSNHESMISFKNAFQKHEQMRHS